jgi:threonine 3-dehydrogenase
MRPSSIYGIGKIYGELLGEYYHSKSGLDFRSLRVPIVTSSAMQSAGGSAAFTVTMFNDLLKNKKTDIPIEPDVKMPLIHLPDLINNILNFMEADS